ncbi:hypothetical protein HAX54_027683, partial [Datura stramonium]|nr:hypothetical protein [Datura stramonium]
MGLPYCSQSYVYCWLHYTDARTALRIMLSIIFAKFTFVVKTGRDGRIRVQSPPLMGKRARGPLNDRAVWQLQEPVKSYTLTLIVLVHRGIWTDWHRWGLQGPVGYLYVDCTFQDYG